MDYKDFLIRKENPTEEWQIKLEAKWAELEEKYGIKFFLQDDSPRPVTEWLDDLYLRFSPEKATQLIYEILSNGDILFANILKHRS